MELMGFNTIETPLELLSILGIHLFYPIVGFNFGLVNILVPVLLVFIIIYLLSKKSIKFSNLTNDTPLVAFIGIVFSIIVFNIFIHGSLQYLFFIYQPPAGHIPLIFGIVTIVSLGFIYFLKYDRDHSLYIGIGSAILWFYWLNQAIFVYELHSFLI